jgi:hypothetical protein
MPSPTQRYRRRRSLAAGLGLWLTVMAALPATAEVRLPGDGGVKVGGTLVNELQIKELSSSSTGEKAMTTLRTNAIERTTVGGNLTNRTTIDTLTLRAEGAGAVSEMAIGTIADVTTGGNLTNSVTLGTSTNIAIGAGARACTELGTLGVRFCD